MPIGSVGDMKKSISEIENNSTTGQFQSAGRSDWGQPRHFVDTASEWTDETL